MKKTFTILFLLIGLCSCAQCDDPTSILLGDPATGCQQTNTNIYFYVDSLTGKYTLAVNGIIIGDIDTNTQNAFISFTQNLIANLYSNTTNQDYYIGFFNSTLLNLDPYVYPTVARNQSKISLDSVNNDFYIYSTPISGSLQNIYNEVTIVMPFYHNATVSPSSTVRFNPILGVAGKTSVLTLIYDARIPGYTEKTPSPH